jgi:hypothetical protein
MTLRTQGGKLLMKDGKLSCECCGSGASCASCASGAYPDTINATVTMNVNDGSATFQVALKKYYSTTDPAIGAGIGVCAEYLYSVGAGANPREVGYDSGTTPTIRFTIKDIGPAVPITLNINFRMSVQFGGNSFRPGGVAVANPLAVRVECMHLNVANNWGGLHWSMENVNGPYSSTTAPLCYSDYAGVTPQPISAGTAFVKYPGTFAMAIVGVA